ncbi:MAG TPA: hypothetical protein VN875_17665 [Candidatus Binatus sp.]|jgi:hypothetical protein|nr:hypothetical protein [Candidatus Binatus sp.]
MIKKCALFFGLIFVLAFTAHAQDSDKVQLYGGYSYLRLDSTPTTNMNGFIFSGEYKINKWLGAVAEFGGEYGSGLHLYTYLFGPQISANYGRFSPFAHVLIGGAHINFDQGFSNNSFAMAVGAGLDAKIVHGVYWRVFEGDYVPTFYPDLSFSGSQSNARFSTGIVVKF